MTFQKIILLKHQTWNTDLEQSKFRLGLRILYLMMIENTIDSATPKIVELNKHLWMNFHQREKFRFLLAINRSMKIDMGFQFFHI